MSEAQKLKNDYDAALAALQASCPHTTCELMDYEWAPGHFSPVKVNVCVNCWKIIPQETMT